MKPDLKHTGGSDVKCCCGVNYTEDGFIHEGMAILYTCVGTISLKYFSIKCRSDSGQISFKETAEEVGIFFNKLTLIVTLLLKNWTSKCTSEHKPFTT